MDTFSNAVEAAMIARALHPDPYTYSEMAAIEMRQDGAHARPKHKHGREADKIMQRWRRKGLATFARIGRETLWSLTDAGRAALAEGGRVCVWAGDQLAVEAPLHNAQAVGYLPAKEYADE